MGPVGGARSEATPSFSTDAPGLGNWTSLESAVKQFEVGMLATNMAGKEGVLRPESSGIAKSVSLRGMSSLLLDPPVTLMEAQFMYISRLPTLLNQVHARVYAPGAMPAGMAKLYVSGSGAVAELSAPMLPATPLAGHPPSIEWMTIHVELLVAGLSVVREIWHDPPPWTDSPKKESFCGAPMAMSVTVPPELLVALQGKLEPSATRGLLSGLPYGGGVAMTMCPCAVVAKRARTEAARTLLIECMSALEFSFFAESWMSLVEFGSVILVEFD